MTDNRLRLVAGYATALGGIVGLVWGIALVVPTSGTADDGSSSTSTSSGSVVETVVFIAANMVFFAVMLGAAASLLCVGIRRWRHWQIAHDKSSPS
ncbi:MAG TPA: hypothetical protein VIL94_07970 [Acidothermaceae bacterium]